MTQKQMVAAILGVGIMVLALVVVARTIGEKTAMNGSINNTNVAIEKMASTDTEKAVVPNTVESIAADIESETALDVSALDDEESSETASVDEDSDSVNNLGTSYDENNL